MPAARLREAPPTKTRAETAGTPRPGGRRSGVSRSDRPTDAAGGRGRRRGSPHPLLVLGPERPPTLRPFIEELPRRTRSTRLTGGALRALVRSGVRQDGATHGPRPRAVVLAVPPVALPDGRRSRPRRQSRPRHGGHRPDDLHRRARARRDIEALPAGRTPTWATRPAAGPRSPRRRRKARPPAASPPASRRRSWCGAGSESPGSSRMRPGRRPRRSRCADPRPRRPCPHGPQDRPPGVAGVLRAFLATRCPGRGPGW